MKNTLVFSIVVFALITGFAQASTIAEIAAMPEGGHATSDAVVILSVTDLVPDPGIKSFQIRDLTRAMTIYGTNAEIDAALTGFGVGDIIGISGYTARLDGALVLTAGGIGGFAVSGRTATAPLLTNALYVFPSDIAASYESNLVCLQNVSFDGTGVFAVGFDYALAGGSAMVRIATDELGLSGLAIPTGPLNITGVVIPDPMFSVGSYCLAPRGIGDIVSVPEPATICLLGLAGLLGIRRRKVFCNVKQFTVLCLAVVLPVITAGTAIASPEALWTMDVISVGNSTSIQLTADSIALLQEENLNTLYRTWGNPTDPSTWIALANGGYIKSVTMGLLAEPVISLDFLVTAGSEDTTFTITSALLGFPAKPFAEGTASAGVTVTDQSGNGATLTGLYSGKAYEATYNGGTLFANLVSPIVATPYDSNTNTENVPSWQPMSTLSSMQSSFKFTLNAGNAASGTSIYTTQQVVPEPATMLLLALGGVLLRKR